MNASLFHRVLPALAVSAAALPVAALAATPTFDCKKAGGEVEKLICSDDALAAQDVALAKAYQAAMAKATGKLATSLKAEQRGWVKGRNDCWKANGQETWITATWTVKTVKDCVDAQHRLRTSELQAVWQLLPPRTVRFACQNNPANEVVASFFDTNPPTIRMERGDRTHTLWQVGAPANGLYEGQNVSLVRQGDGLKVNRLNTDTGKTEELDCKAR
jgi:uncharacterized protein YecT (DUF1311 family)